MAAANPLRDAFDAHSADYDARWEADPVARWQRARIHRRLSAVLPPAPARVLDLGCGTGTDAAFLASLGHRVVGIDGAPGMIAAARARCPGADFTVADLATDELPEGPFDAAISNFGALNCVPLAPLGARLAARLRPGAVFVLVLIARTSPAETLTLLAAGHLREAWFRRRRGVATVGGREIPVAYPRTGEVLTALRDGFVCEHREGIGALAHPPGRGRGPGRLAALEPSISALPGLRRLGDHVIYTFRRR